MIVKRAITKDEISRLPKEDFNGRMIVVQTELEVEQAIEYLNSF